MVIFDGVKYYKCKKGYMEARGPSRGKPRPPFKFLHQAVWVAYNGPIPPGYDPHHKNENKEDNRIENLELLTKEEHGRLHAIAYWATQHATLRTCHGCGKKTSRIKWCSQLCINRDAARTAYHELRSDPVKWEAYLKREREKYAATRTSIRPYRPRV